MPAKKRAHLRARNRGISCRAISLFPISTEATHGKPPPNAEGSFSLIIRANAADFNAGDVAALVALDLIAGLAVFGRAPLEVVIDTLAKAARAREVLMRVAWSPNERPPPLGTGRLSPPVMSPVALAEPLEMKDALAILVFFALVQPAFACRRFSIWHYNFAQPRCPNANQGRPRPRRPRRPRPIFLCRPEPEHLGRNRRRAAHCDERLRALNNTPSR